MTALLLAIFFTYVNVPVSDMRTEPSHASKVDSQVIYSERVEILEEKEDWAKIKTHDSYTGWLLKSALYTSDKKFLENQGCMVARINRCAAHLYGVKDTEYGPIKTLPFESLLEVNDQFGDLNGRWIEVRLVDNTPAYIQRGDIALNPPLIEKSDLAGFSLQFLGLPYTWGGKSSFGYDCSGFVQMLYRQMGVNLPRNSRDQAKWDGFREIEFDDLSEGDLVFFGRVEGKISHVGMYLGAGQFIHATVAENKPYIHISSLDDPTWSGSGEFVYRLARTLK